MYGSEKDDLIVKYYDIAFGISGEAEIQWYLTKAQESGGPVLDLCCGTGRISLMLANNGFEVTGVDQSEGMLKQFKRNFLKQPDDVRQRIQIENQRMTDFALGKKFKTIICCDAFFHNLAVEDEINCLQSVKEHLVADGRFLFNIHNPNCAYILESKASNGEVFHERGHYQFEDGSGSLLVEEANSIDVDQQTTVTTLRLTKLDPQNNPIEKAESNWKTRYLYRYEAVHLLYRFGFEVESLVGDYKNGPVTEDSQLIFDVKLNQ